MHGRVILLLAFALWASVAAAQTLKYDWERPLPTTALTISSDGSRIATRSSNAQGMMTVILYDGRTGYPIDTVLIDHGPTPQKFRYHIAFIDSTLLTLVVQDSMYFRVVKYNERDASFDTLNADLIYRVQFKQEDLLRQLELTRFQGEFPRGTVMLCFAEGYARPSTGYTESSGGSVFVNVYKDSAWIGPGRSMGRVAYSGDRTRMLITLDWSEQHSGIGRWDASESHSVRLYEGEQCREVGQFNLPRREDKFASSTVMGRSQTVISGCNRWLGLIQDSLELSWAQIPGFDCEYWHSLAGNSKVVGIRNNPEKQRYELVVSDIITKQLEVVDYWTTSATRWIAHASSVAKAVYVVIDNNRVRRYTFHPSFEETYQPSIELIMPDTVQHFQTVGFTALPVTSAGFRVDSIKSGGGTFKFAYGQHSIVGSFIAEVSGLHDVELWCTTIPDSEKLYTKRKLFVERLNGVVCAFKSNYRLQNMIVGQGRLIVSPGPTRSDSYVCLIDSLIARGRFVADESLLLSSAIVLEANDEKAVLVKDCTNPQSDEVCLDIVEVKLSTYDTLLIGNILIRQESGYHSYPILPVAHFVQYAEIAGAETRIIGVRPKYYEWGLEQIPEKDRYGKTNSGRLIRGGAWIYAFDSAKRSYKHDYTYNANSIDSYQGSNVLLTFAGGGKVIDGKPQPTLGTWDTESGQFRVEAEYVGRIERDAIRCTDSIYMTPSGIYRLMPTGELSTVVYFVDRYGVDIVRINNTLSAVIRESSDTVAVIYNHFTGEIVQHLGSTLGRAKTGAYSPEHRMFFVGSDSGVVTGYDITRVVSVTDESSSTISQVAARYHIGSITIDVGLPIDEVVVYAITGERMFSAALLDRPLQTSVTAPSWSSGAYVVRVRSGQRWGTAKVAVVR